MRSSALLVAIFVFGSAWALAGTSRANAQSHPYPVLDSRISAESRGLTYRLTWIDNDRLMFSGEPVVEVLARFETKARSRRLRIYIWDTRTTEVKEYAELGDFGRFCYNELENWIRYPVIGKPNLIKEGQLGQEIEVTINPRDQTPEARHGRGVFVHELTCKEYSFAPSDSGADRWVFPLYLDHGVLDVRGDQIDARPIKLYSNDYKRVIELPLPRRAVEPTQIYFSKYKNAYVLFGNSSPPSFADGARGWPKGVNQPIYLLSLDGKITPAGEIPWHEEFGRALGVFFTVKGLAYIRGRPQKSKGIFLVTGKSAVRLLAGSMIAGGISPNGCKLAAAISLDNGNRSGGVKVIDLCRGGKQ